MHAPDSGKHRFRGLTRTWNFFQWGISSAVGKSKCPRQRGQASGKVSMVSFAKYSCHKMQLMGRCVIVQWLNFPHSCIWLSLLVNVIDLKKHWIPVELSNNCLSKVLAAQLLFGWRKSCRRRRATLFVHCLKSSSWILMNQFQDSWLPLEGSL